MAHESGKVSPTHRPPLPPGNIPGTHFCWRLSRPQSHSAAGRVISMKNSSDTIRNRTRDLPACSAVPQPTAPPRAPLTKRLQPNDNMEHNNNCNNTAILVNCTMTNKRTINLQNIILPLHVSTLLCHPQGICMPSYTNCSSW
jgi:hypothetical protein